MQDGTPIIIKKKKGRKHAHHGGAWKVAYADFVTAMMAFFLVMWILSLSDEEKQLVQAYFEDPTGFSKTHPRSDTHIEVFPPMADKPNETNDGNAELQQAAEARGEIEKAQKAIEEAIRQDAQLQQLVQQKSIEMTITAEGLTIELIESDLNGEVFFKVGSAEVQPRAREVIAKIAPILAETGHAIVVEGHTDSRPYGSPNYDNYMLSTDRAHAVRRLLGAGGVADAQMEGVKGYADQKPRVKDDPAHFSNRRVTVLLPFSFEAPRKIMELPSDKLSESVEGVFRNPVRGRP